MVEAIANISQNDKLSSTFNDNNRCGAASMINAYLLLGGSFADAAGKFNLEKDFTYKNVHLLQEKLYEYANSDNKAGLVSSYRYFYNNNGS